ncbi:BC1881 family protein [Tissierella sp.]|uniref:BC1881 family protein n=1 Tax=Tissierella sp. TaxID=41274 RepID=UPI00301F08D8
MLKDVSTKNLVEELSRRQGVNSYKAEFDAKYNITVKTPGFVEDTSTTVIKEGCGPAIILEVVD